MDLNGQFFFVKDNKPVGPFTLDELLEKDISSKTFIWTKGMTNWEKIESIPVILERINNNKNQPPVFIEPKSEGNNITQKGKGVNKTILFAFLGVIVLLLGFISFRLIKDDSIVTVNETLENSVENDLKKVNLKGEVIYTYTKEIYSYFNHEIHHEFNSKGFKTKVTGWNSEFPAFNYSAEYIYEDEKLVKIMNSRINPTYTTYINDFEGKILKETFVNADDKSIIYTSDYIYKNGLLIEESKSYDNGTSISKYNYTSNNLNSIIIQNNNLEDKTIEFDHIYFNEKGQEIKHTYSNGSSINTREYNEVNEIKKEVINNTDGIEVNLFTYSFDEKGNWIEKYKNGELESSRRIYYKGDDLTMVKNELMNKMESSYSKSDNSNSESQNNQSRDQSNNNSTSSNNNSSKNSQIPREECWDCKGSGDCQECSKTFRKEFYKGNGSYDSRNETKQGYVMCNDCSGRGHKQVKRERGGWEPGLDCHVTGCMDGWQFCHSCNNSGRGTNIGECRKCRGTGYRN